MMTLPLHQSIQYLVKNGYKLEITDKFVTVTDKRTDEAVSYDHYYGDPLAVTLADFVEQVHKKRHDSL